jgi:hypothetical protein
MQHSVEVCESGAEWLKATQAVQAMMRTKGLEACLNIGIMILRPNKQKQHEVSKGTAGNFFSCCLVCTPYVRASYVHVKSRADIIFTGYSTASFTRTVLTNRANQVIISPITLLPSGWAVVIHAQSHVVLQPQSVPHREQSSQSLP